MQNTQGEGTLFGVVLDRTSGRLLFISGAVLFGICLLTLSAKLQVPFWPVPMTMQTLVVLMLGMAYGPRLGAGTVVAYLLVGAVGFPVFAGTPERGIGLAYMMGPTGGFLMGFVAAAWITGALAEVGAFVRRRHAGGHGGHFCAGPGCTDPRHRFFPGH